MVFLYLPLITIIYATDLLRKGKNTFKLGYNVMKGTAYFELLYTSVVLTENNGMVNSEELTCTTEYMTLQQGVIQTDVIITRLNHYKNFPTLEPSV